MAILACCCITFPSSAQNLQFSDVQAIIKPELQNQRTRKMRQLVQRIGSRFIDPARFDGAVSSFGLGIVEYATTVEEDTEISPSGTFWFEGGRTRLEDTAPLRSFKGYQNSLSIGVDWQASETLLVGLIGNYSESDIDDVFVPGNSSTEAISTGPYFAYFLTDTTILTGSFLYSWTDNQSVGGGVIAAYDSEGWQANLTLTDYRFVGDVVFAPSIGISFDEERDEAYLDSAARAFAASTSRSGALAIGLTASSSVDLGNGMLADPYVGIEGEWMFDRSVDAIPTVVADDAEFDANLSFGVDLQFGETFSLDFSGSYAGLARGNYDSLTGIVRLSFSF